jgi:signal peptidase I
MPFYNGSNLDQIGEKLADLDSEKIPLWDQEENKAEEQPSVQTEPAGKKTSLRSFFMEILQTVLLALILYFLIDSVVARVRVENISMQPTLQPGEFILVNRLAYRFGEVQRGDIIIFHNPQNPMEDYVKRVIGVPGDNVIVRNGKVEINGQVLDEDYISAPPTYDGVWKISTGSLFVLGDNRNQSSDSHSWGFVPNKNVVGRALVIYWPLNKVRVLNEPIRVRAAN